MKPAGMRTRLEYRAAHLRRRLALGAIRGLDAIADRLDVWADRLAVALLEAEVPAITAASVAAPVRVIPHCMGIFVESPSKARVVDAFLHADLELPRELQR